MSSRLVSFIGDVLAHPLTSLLWLCFALVAPWVSLAIDPYLWALVSLVSLYVSVPQTLVCGVQLFRVRGEPMQKRTARRSLFMSIAATTHLVIHLVWVTRIDWSF